MNILFFASHWFVEKIVNSSLNKLLKLRNRHLFVCDILIFAVTPVLALSLRLDGSFLLHSFLPDLVIASILFLAVKQAVFWCFGFYRRYWRYASVEELVCVGLLMGSAIVVQTILFDVFYYAFPSLVDELPRSLAMIDGLLSLIFVGALRFSVRVMERVKYRRTSFDPSERVLIIGAGSAGVSLVQEMQQNPQFGFHPVAFIDDNPRKLKARIRGVQVVGDRHTIPEVVNTLQIQKVVIAMPAVAGRVIREIVDICKQTGIQTSTLPGVHEILNGKVRVDSIRDVRIEDLLRREPVQTDTERVSQFIKGKRVLITGAGGSIGSELCRQICRCRPSEIMLVGHGENSVFTIQHELEQLVKVMEEEGTAQRYTPSLSLFIADIRHRERLKHGFVKFLPDVIFHAAAHKHVPLMELNPPEAITNNVQGTKNLVDLAVEFNVKHFVMISTDKAVNPTNVMGASKRVAEMLVLQAAKEHNKSYVVVRFGNVLGSRGSVVPTFKKQIAAGGPITVTHPDICRYFMTIPEAVQLVLQAAVLAGGGQVLMLNMGEPVKIVDLAKELIRLSGYEVGKDIDIVFSGLRPGEKLFEELFIEGEEYDKTQHEKLFLVKNASRIIPGNLKVTVEALCTAAKKNDANVIRFLLEQVVPGYKPKCLESDVRADFLSQNPSLISSNGNMMTKVEAKEV